MTLMIQGCTSDAGKSVLVAGLCRVLYRRGKKVAPFMLQLRTILSATHLRRSPTARGAPRSSPAAASARMRAPPRPPHPETPLV